MAIKILLLEDDSSLLEGLIYSLEKENYEVTVARTVCDALTEFSTKKFDLLILDVSLPDGTGFTVCKKARESSDVPILFLTAADEEMNVIRGLDSGGDDYITKPFRLGELLSRIRALLRRSEMITHEKDNLIKSSNVEVDLLENKVTLNGVKLELTGAEFRLLTLFLRNIGKTLTRRIVFETLWDESGDFVDDNTLSVYVRRLREKIEEDPSHPKHLITVRGFGYMWKE